ncbi:MAG: phosphoribosylformylglycinamidine synthase I [Planctomycetota bacterium]
MSKINAIVLRAAGINCDVETAYALECAGASAERVHVNRLIEKSSLLEGFTIAVLPGGFSYGDDVAAGKILANQVIHHLSDSLEKFVAAGKLVLGICNGFQVLVKTGILPGWDSGNMVPGTQSVTITYNDSGKFEDRWVYLSPGRKRCVFLDADRIIYLPIAHGEGKVVVKGPDVLERLNEGGHAALRYVDKDGRQGGYPTNPNGSVDSIAGLMDQTGRVFGLMPHPERFVRPVQHPHWSRLKGQIRPDGMMIFENAVRFARANL